MTVYQTTTHRYWCLDAYPDSPVIESTVTEFNEPDGGGATTETTVSVTNTFPAAGATLITEQDYLDTIANRDDPAAEDWMQNNADASLAAHKANCATAYDDLIAAGVPAATATFLTGHTP